MRRSHTGRDLRITGLALAGLVLGLGADRVLAQFPQRRQQVPGLNRPDRTGRGESQESSARRSRLFVTDRRTTRRLDTARDLLQQEDYSQAVVLLQSLLDQGEDFFFQPEGDAATSSRSVKAEAEQLIASLPSEARRAYRLRYGAKARQMLRDAVGADDLDALEEVTRRFFHTPAGYEAAYRLGNEYLDRAQPLAALLQFERLNEHPETARQWEPMLSLKTAVCWLLAGRPRKSREVLVRLKETTPQNRITVGGREVRLFEDPDQATSWLSDLLDSDPRWTGMEPDDWRLVRGSPARNSASNAALPVREEAWTVPTAGRISGGGTEANRRVASALAELKSDAEEENLLTLPAGHPLVIGDSVVFRTLRNLRAVDLDSGELQWETTLIDPTSRILLETESSRPMIRGIDDRAFLQLFLAQRLWQDATAGTLSSDGRYVFAVEDAGAPGLGSNEPRAFFELLGQRDQNRLVAYELAAEGRAAWELGGASSGTEGHLAGACFLGPPLPLDQRLYCLAEVQGEVRLLVVRINPSDGSPELEWSQSLAVPEVGVENHPDRHLSGLSPSYSNGVLVCPTTAGAVVAVDLTRRALLWGYRYPTTLPEGGDFGRGPRSQLSGLLSMVGGDGHNRWVDSVPIIADGRVLLTPRDSAELHCLNLMDGSVEWKKRRGESLYVAAVYDGAVIVVGRNQVQALSLRENGTPVWTEPTPIPMPAGRGFRNGPLYRLPLSTGEVATIDLETGRIVARSPLRAGRVPGNLVTAGGRIISQSDDAVTGFRALQDIEQDVRRDLQRDPDNPQALALRGEMRLHQGQVQQGLADLLEAIRQGAAPRAGELVVRTLIEGLRMDFDRYSDRVDEIERLVQDPQQRAMFLRRYAVGLQEQGKSEAAFRQYLKLASSETGRPRMERSNGSLSIRSDRWVRPRLTELYNDASAEVRRAMEAQIRDRLESALEKEGPEPLRRFLKYFAGTPVADEARRALVKRLDPAQRPLESALQLRRLQQSEDPSLAGLATARLARLLIERGRARQAGDLLERLSEQYADVECLDGRTGHELVDEWLADEEISAALQEEKVWPARQLQARRVDSHGGIHSIYPMEVDGPPGSSYEDWSFELGRGRRQLIARDGHGRIQWKCPLTSAGDRIENPRGNTASIHGPLMAVTVGNRLFIINLLPPSGAPRVLWQKEAHAGGEWDTGIPQVVQMQRFGAPGRRVVAVNSSRNGGGIKVALMNEELICYRTGSRLYAADPLTGNILWERRNTPAGSKVFGDENFVLVVPPQGAQAHVLRTGDGREVAVRALPDAGAIVATVGRHPLLWTDSQGKSRLKLVDVVSRETLWERTFAQEARLRLVEGDEAAILDPQGRFTVLALQDGRPQLDVEISAVQNLEEFLVLRSRKHYVLLTHVPDEDRDAPRVIGLGYFNTTNVNGPAYGFDRATGSLLWSRRIENQAVDLSQPESLPVLVFLARIRQGGGQRRQFNTHRFEMLVVDKRTGETVYSREGSDSLYPFQFDVQPESHQVNINFYRWKVTITPTDMPLPGPQ